MRVDQGGAAIQEPHLQGLTGASSVVLQHWGRPSQRPAAALPNRAASGLFEKVSVARTAPLSRTIQRPRASGKNGRLCTGADDLQPWLLCHVK